MTAKIASRHRLHVSPEMALLTVYANAAYSTEMSTLRGTTMSQLGRIGEVGQTFDAHDLHPLITWKVDGAPALRNNWHPASAGHR
jgi:hypothetical protein